MAEHDRVRWPAGDLPSGKFRLSFKIASGATNPAYVPFTFYVDGRPVEPAGPIRKFASVLKGESWEFFGGDLPIEGVHQLGGQTAIEAEANGDYLLVYNLTLLPVK